MIHDGDAAAKERQIEEEAEREREEMKKHADKVVISSDESFPASDPPSFNPGTTGAADVQKKKR